MPIPIEFVVRGRPSSVNGSAAKAMTWKMAVSKEANISLAAKFAPSLPPAAYADDATVKVFFFPPNDQYTDVDNGLKHTIDAISEHRRPVPPSPPFASILANDKTIQRVVAERFPPVPNASLIVPIGFAPTLARALMIANGQTNNAAGTLPAEEYATAIKVEPYTYNNGGLW
ncbi:hypothetical protein [Chromobacterium vaccinii]|uniref:hypothetical protein n=1 Tax=Chromobacterium vaccinii TaxID=1108595 RepID=UPI001E503AE8|nr:hypothetical protein [Chromobacterium vaccinii]MCD4500166.1 hypothetical protein [Chromobacterium vaccinii]